MDNKTILIVEDDEITALNLKISLEKHNYTIISICDNITDAKSKIKKFLPDLIIIDISLQEGNDGIKLAKSVRKKQKIPFIFLTSYSDDDIISQAKLTQPYGYIVKPFDPNSLHATIQMALFKFEIENKKQKDNTTEKLDLDKLLHSKKSSENSIIKFGDNFHLDISINETFYKNKKIKLTKKENAFFKLLVAKLGLVVSFEEAMNYVWNKNGATENSVRTLVWRLRNKLEENVIKSASGIGYYIEE
jgi:DNA-binding response OmpR family regulator